MAKFRSPQELTAYLQRFAKVTSAHKAILVNPTDEDEIEVPADQVQHYLDKGFEWPQGPSKADPEPSEGNVPNYPPPRKGRRPKGATSSRSRTAKAKR